MPYRVRNLYTPIGLIAVATVLVGGFGGSSLSPVYGQSNGSTNFTTDFHSTAVSLCGGESVDLSSTAHFVIHESFSSDGTLHRELQLNHQHTEGIGVTTGDKYTFQEHGHQSIRNSDTSVFHFTVTGTLIHNGKPTDTASNSLITIVLQTIFDADGAKTIVDHVDIKCPGI
jgi:hypothetical protein